MMLRLAASRGSSVARVSNREILHRSSPGPPGPAADLPAAVQSAAPLHRGLRLARTIDMGSVFGKRNVEEPAHDIKFTAEQLPSHFEIRRYPARWAISTENDSGGFMRLAGYIGVGSKPKNAGAAPIAMTAPVVVEKATKTKGTAIAMTAPVVNLGSEMKFILPSKFGEGDVPPEPLDDRVRVELLPAEYMAVTTFNGSLNRDADSDPRAQAQRDQIVKDAKEVGLMDDNVSPDELESRVYRYNPPWCLPYWKTNEVAIPLTAEQVGSFLAEKTGDG